MNKFTRFIAKTGAFSIAFLLVFIQVDPIISYAITAVSTSDVHTVTTSIVKDSYVDQDSTGNKNTTNYGSANSIEVKSANGKNRRMFIQAEMPVLPEGAVIESAQLHIYMYNEPNPQSIRMYSVSQVTSSWAENDITWNNQPGIAAVPTSVLGIFPGNNVWTTYEVGEDVKNMITGQSVNNGWVIQDKFEDASSAKLGEFRSREYASNQPYLEITYRQVGTITGSVWNDVNANGLKDEGELPRPDETVWVYDPSHVFTATTTSDGTYSVKNIPLGEYKVCRTTLNNNILKQSFPSSGALCPGNTFGARVQVSGGSVVGPDFGVFEAGNVKVVLGMDPDLTQGSFKFDLLRDGATTSTQTLDAWHKEYVFSGLVAGNYSISQITPEGWALVGSSCVSNTGTGYASTTLSVIAGEQITCEFSNIKTASLTITNYIQPVQGTYSFTLSSSVGDDTLVFEPVTLGNSESHTFKGIIPGTYNLLETVDGEPLSETAVCSVGDTTVDPRSTSLVIPAGADIQCTYNHGEFAVVQGNVFEDMNANGVQDEEDASRAGWVVKLFKITEEMVNSGDEENPVMVPTQVVTELGSKITSAAGYVFGQLNPGTYKVCEEVQSGSTQSFPVTGEDCTGSKGHFVTLNFGDVVTKHFGNFSKGSVMGIVFGDTNNNGTQDEGETGLSGVAVTLGSYSATTDTTGQYSFADVQPAEYTLTIVPPANSSYSVPTAGNYAFTVSSGGNYVHKDFGVFTDTDTPALPTHVSPVDGSVVKASGLVLDWSDAIDPSASAVTYLYQSSLSNATTTGNALSTPIYSTSLSISQIDASGTSEGTYFWQVKACDVAHNCTDWTNPWAITVDNTAPVSVFATPTSDVTVEDDFVTISGTTTDAHMVASTTLAFAPYTLASESETASCGAYANIVSLVNPIASTTYVWTYNWTPTEDGVYCLTAHGQDEAGNVEASPVITNITFKKKIVVVPTNTDNGGSGGNGGGSSGSAGGNGPIVGAFGIGGSFMSGAPSTEVALGGNTVDTGLPTSPSTQNTESTGNEGATTYETTGRGIAYGGVPALTDSSSTSSTTRTENDGPVFDEGAVKSQLAAIGSLGEWSNWYWLWILIVLIIIGGVYYSTRDRNK